jgi:hypothetical protein
MPPVPAAPLPDTDRTGRVVEPGGRAGTTAVLGAHAQDGSHVLPPR